MAEHVADFIADRRSVGCDEKYVRELHRKLLRLANECKWREVRDVTVKSFCSWRDKEAKTKSAKTVNEYLHAINGLMNWLQPRVGTNPLRFVEKAELNGKQKRERRAFTAEELERLCRVSGRRGFVYRIAARTGIRRGELEEIEVRDVHLEKKLPFMIVRASISKNHKQAMQPLTPDAVQALRGLIPDDARPTDRVFKGWIPRMPRFRADLEAAGIPYVDPRGEYADFHSLRKTFGTMLTLAGVGQRTVMELMRHSDMRLTAKTYTDANMLPVSDAVALLSAFAAKQENPQIDPQKSATESRAGSSSVAINGSQPKLLTVGDERLSLSETASVPSSPERAENARCRVRTCDLSPRRPLLSQRNRKGFPDL
jgi:integrase